MVAAQASWLLIVCVLGAWWGELVVRQAQRISELEQQLGLSTGQSYWERTERMLLWESSVFFLLLLGSTAILFWFYWRDLKRSRSLQAFFAGVTHELRTPLTSIRLQAESIAENLSARLGSEAQERDLLDRLLEDTHRLEGQVERTLELARVEGGGPIDLQSLELKPWVERMAREWERDYGGKVQIRKTWGSDLEDAVIAADPAAMKIVFRNLFENSIRHSKKAAGLQVELSAQNGSGQGAEDSIELVFRDNGEGFSSDPRVLGEIFRRGPGSQGSGVGLYLIRMLMERMGGSVRFANRKGDAGFEATLSFQKRGTDG